MKKVISIFILAVTLIAAGTAFESHAAPKATKSSSKKKSASVIGKFTADDVTCSLLSNGKLKIYAPHRFGKLTGRYKKVNGGQYYIVEYGSGDGSELYLIVGNDVYFVDAGSEFYITDFTYNPNTEEIKINKIDGTWIYSDADLEDNPVFNSRYVPLSDLEWVGTIKWTK